MTCRTPSPAGRIGRAEPCGHRQDARPLAAGDNGALCSPCRRSSESGQRCRGQTHCCCDGRCERRDYWPAELKGSSQISSVRCAPASPLCARKRTFVGPLSMSAKCQKRTSEPASSSRSKNPSISRYWWAEWVGRCDSFKYRITLKISRLMPFARMMTKSVCRKP